MKGHNSSTRILLLITFLLNFIVVPVRAQLLQNLLGRLVCGFAERRVEGLLGDSVNCGCKLTFPFTISFGCQYRESYCIGPQNLLEICGKPKLTGSYGLGVPASTEFCFVGDDENDPLFTGDFCLKGYHSPNFIQFDDCDATYNGVKCQTCDACKETGFFFRYDCSNAGGPLESPVLACIGLGIPN